MNRTLLVAMGIAGALVAIIATVLFYLFWTQAFEAPHAGGGITFERTETPDSEPFNFSYEAASEAPGPLVEALEDAARDGKAQAIYRTDRELYEALDALQWEELGKRGIRRYVRYNGTVFEFYASQR